MASLGVILCVGAVTFIIIGVPVAYAMISAGALTLIANETALLVLPQRLFTSINSFSLMAIL